MSSLTRLVALTNRIFPRLAAHGIAEVGEAAPPADPARQADHDEGFADGYRIAGSRESFYPAPDPGRSVAYRAGFGLGARLGRRDEANRRMLSRGFADALDLREVPDVDIASWAEDEELHYLRGFRSGTFERDAREDAMFDVMARARGYCEA